MTISSLHDLPRSTTRTLLRITAVEVWVILLAVAALRLLPQSLGPWQSATAQVAVYVVCAVPVLLAQPMLMRGFLGGSRKSQMFGLALVVAAVGYAALRHGATSDQLVRVAIRGCATAVVEELVFRGYLWERCVELLHDTWKAVVLNAVLFAGFHLPVAVIRGNEVSQLAATAAFGVVFCLVRKRTRNLAAPTRLHWAIDISGS